MSRTDPVVHIRMPEDAVAEVDAAAAADGLCRATWCREIFAAVTRAGLSVDALADLLTSDTPVVPAQQPRQAQQQEPERPLGGPHRVLTGRCLHPPHLVRRLPTQDVCRCGTVVARRNRP